MFEIKNVYTSRPLSVDISYGDESYSFPIGVSKINKDLLNKSFDFANLYVKGREGHFIKMYAEASKLLTRLVINNNIVNDTMEIISKYLDKDDMKRFGKSKVRVPSHIPELYTKEKGSNNTREQTFIKEEYYDLVVVCLVSKLTLPIFSMLENLMDGKPRTTIIDAMQEHLELEGIEKLYLLTEAMSRRAKDSVGQLASAKGVPVDRIHVYATWVIFKRLFSVDPRNDTVALNLTTVSYNVANPLLNNGGGIVQYSPQGTLDEHESVLEAARTHTEITPGEIEEFRWVANDTELIIETLGIDKDEFHDNCKKYAPMKENRLPPDATIDIVGWICKDILHPMSLEYLQVDGLINLYAGAYTWLMKEGFEATADLLLTTIVDIEDDVAFTTKKQIPKELKEEAKETFVKYPFVNPSSKTDIYNLIMSPISDLLGSKLGRINKPKNMSIPADPMVLVDVTRLLIYLNTGRK